MKVLSLIASATEIVAALGAESMLVGRSHECDFPAAVTKLPQVTVPSFPTGGSSAEIDREVKSRVRDALSIYEVDREKLRALAPDVILTQTQCEVCAVSLKDVERALAGEAGFSGTLVSLTPNSLADVHEDIRRVARAIGLEPRGDRLVAELKGKFSAISRIADRLNQGRTRPRVAIVEWIEPLMAAGNWMPELVFAAGGENLFGEAGKHSPSMTFDDLVAKDPDVVIVAPCGFGLARTRKELHLLTEEPRFRGLRAFREGRVAIADGNQYFNRPGPRTLGALEILAEILYPGKFEFERPPLADGSPGWERVTS
ncbi:MAG: cobalamin-binding protein [Bdellovibrionales bacterium]|nr:cobalamin-binding protein [Bdellovibrionales bacterium]